MQSFKKVIVAVLIMFPLAVLYAQPSEPSAFIDVETQAKTEIVKAFRYYKTVSPSIPQPTVLEVPFSEESFSIPTFAVYNLNSYIFEPYLLSISRMEAKVNILTNGAIGSPSLMNDGNYITYLEFPLNGNSGRAEITYHFEQPIVSSSLSFVLDANVALPQRISISADVSGSVYTVLAPTQPRTGNVVFPKTTSSVWRVVLDYVQPLRISEMKFNDISTNKATERGLRFLAQPGQKYQIYFDADRYVQSTNKEAGDLFSRKGLVFYDASASIPNSEYQAVDSDLDSIPDWSDNCVSVPNIDQTDLDNNNRGDACEDYDRDNVFNANDNCPETPNVSQMDTDADGIGDACDSLDNRVTERLPWLPWLGIGIAGIVLLGLFIMALRYKKVDES